MMVREHPDVDLIVIGGGLAGTDAAWSAARHGLRVALYEMRPRVMTPAHKTDRLAELVCSNSLKSNLLTTAAGLLKQEMRLLGSLVISAADRSAVPSGGALSVDRERFAEIITEAITGHPSIELIREEMPSLPDDIPAIVATGPLTSEALAAEIQKIAGREQLYFYDAASPIIDADSIDRSICFEASRYGKGQEQGGAGGYLNCPLNEAEYHAFRAELLKAEKVPLKEFEPIKLFEGCLPIEEMAARGEMTMAFGPMKPVGLVDPRTGQRPFAVVQLRQENEGATLYSMVAFQTRLTWPEQRRIFRMIPGLQDAEFVRLGVMHRNTYLCSPELLEPTMRLREETAKGTGHTQQAGYPAPLFFAGQMTGVEGYTESAATGIIAGINAARILRGLAPFVPPQVTMIGALCDYISHGPADNFQPMNSNLGLLPPLEVPIRKKEERQAALIQRALQTMERAAAEIAPREPVAAR
jgi:methylenetetrahydrofolate--tRNA-(uracil-5-)-methyltransferase